MIRKKIKEAARRRWWDIKIRVFHRKINRRKYYGVKKNIEEYAKIIEELFDEPLSKIEQALGRGQEANLPKLIMSLVSVKITPLIMEKIAALFDDAFSKGARRVFTRTGDKIKVGEVKNKLILQALISDQLKYVKNLEEDLKDIIMEELIEGTAEGKSIFEIKERIAERTRRISKTRAALIARSEIIKASAAGTKQSMQEAGIEYFIWLSARDNRVCKICQQLDGKKFRVGEDAPMPVRNTHPNCRCTLVADI